MSYDEVREELARLRVEVKGLKESAKILPAHSIGNLMRLANQWADEGKSRSGVQTARHKTLWRCAAELRVTLGLDPAYGGNAHAGTDDCERCGDCFGTGIVLVPCPDNKPECLVAHQGPCPACGGTGRTR